MLTLQFKTDYAVITKKLLDDKGIKYQVEEVEKNVYKFEIDCDAETAMQLGKETGKLFQAFDDLHTFNESFLKHFKDGF